MAVKAVRVIVSGDVQGVGMRDWIAPQAIALDLDGSVRNLPDGTVELVIKGDADNVDEMLRRLDPDLSTREIRTRGRPGSIDSLDVERVDPGSVPEGFRRLSGGDAPNEREQAEGLDDLRRAAREDPAVISAYRGIRSAVENYDFNGLIEAEGEMVEALEQHYNRTQAADHARDIIHNTVRDQGGWPQFIKNAVKGRTVPKDVRKTYDALMEAAESGDYDRIRRAWQDFDHAMQGNMPDDRRLANKISVKILEKAMKNIIPGLGIVFSGLAAYGALSAASEMRAIADELQDDIGADEYQGLIDTIDEILRLRLGSAATGAVSIGGPLTAAAAAVTQQTLEQYADILEARFERLMEQYQQALEQAAKDAITQAVEQETGEEDLSWNEVLQVLRDNDIDAGDLLDNTMQDIETNNPQFRGAREQLQRMEDGIEIFRRLERSRLMSSNDRSTAPTVGLTGEDARHPETGGFSPSQIPAHLLPRNLIPTLPE